MSVSGPICRSCLFAALHEVMACESQAALKRCALYIIDTEEHCTQYMTAISSMPFTARYTLRHAKLGSHLQGEAFWQASRAKLWAF